MGLSIRIIFDRIRVLFYKLANLTPQKSLSLIIIDDSNRLNKSNIKKELGIIKRLILKNCRHNYILYPSEKLTHNGGVFL